MALLSTETPAPQRDLDAVTSGGGQVAEGQWRCYWYLLGAYEFLSADESERLRIGAD
jgi:hypothetical protein